MPDPVLYFQQTTHTGDAMKGIVGYIRVSTEGQADSGVSLEAQQERIMAWATANGADLLAIHQDAGLSAKRADNRPALQAALAQACREKAPLVCYSLSRLSRSVKDCCEIGEKLAKAGADLVSLSERIDSTTAAGRMIFHVLASFAEFERSLAAERTTEAMSHLRSQGRRISGAIPYGYNLAGDGTTLIENPEQQANVRLICDLRGDGWSLRAIAGELERRGIPSKSGRQWSSRVVWGIINRTKRLERAA
jgi:site-specific DNA recombinase